MKYNTLFLILTLILPIFLLIIPIQKVYAVGTTTYNPTTNIITTVGGTEIVPITFNDLWLADKSGTLILKSSATYTSNTSINLDTPIRATDYGDIVLYFDVTSITGVIRIEIFGYTAEGIVGVTDDFNISGVITFPTTSVYNSLVFYGIILYIDVGESITFSIYQSQWGVIWKTGTNEYMLDCRLAIGDGSTTTWFIDTAKQITFNNVFSANGQYAMDIRDDAYVQFGTLNDATTKSTKNGCDFTLLSTSYTGYLFYTATDYNQNNRQLYVYSSSFYATEAANRIFGYLRGGNMRFWHILIKQGAAFVYSPFTGSPSCNIYDITIAECGTAFIQIYGSTGLTIDRVISDEAQDTIWTQAATTFTILNVISRRASLSVFAGSTSWSGNAYLVNFDVDTWTMRWVASATGEVYRQYSFDLTTTYANETGFANANITISHYGVNSGIDFNGLTDSNGEIPQQILTMGFYNYTGGNNIYSYNPYNIKIENNGIELLNQNFTLTDKIVWSFPLQIYEEINLWIYLGILGLSCSVVAIALLVKRR